MKKNAYKHPACDHVNEETITAYDGYGGEAIPIGFKDIYYKISEFKRIHQNNASFYPKNPYNDSLAKIRAEINELLNLSPQYKELAKSYFWDGNCC